MIFVSLADHAALAAQSQSKGGLFVELNKFIVKVGKAKDIFQGSIGLSKFQREAFRISKSEELKLRIPKIEANPLS
jgi:hypothetical protein